MTGLSSFKLLIILVLKTRLMVPSAPQLRGTVGNLLWQRELSVSLSRLPDRCDKQYNFHVIAGYAVQAAESCLRMTAPGGVVVLTSSRSRQTVLRLLLGHGTDNRDCFQGVGLLGQICQIQS